MPRTFPTAYQQALPYLLPSCQNPDIGKIGNVVTAKTPIPAKTATAANRKRTRKADKTAIVRHAETSTAHGP
jgi:hypothetical protein